ncbi:hypothetical protein VTN00DRAFT_5340 [Thermoascus crustaceus]|uniref:uncharacterized protein n=1 Tax=Thermoascus crustaceus TaxID=5088 RepID=UPI003742B16C
MSKTTQSTRNSRMQNEFGADLWIRDPNNHRQPTAGRGLFAGLQDVKHYNVERGWAKREPDTRQGFFASVFNSSRAERESWWRSMRAMVMRAATEYREDT